MAQLPSVRERGESLLSREFMVADDGAWRMEANARTWIWTSTDERAFHFVELSSGIPFMRYHTHARAINLRWVERVEGGLKLGEVMREGHREGVKARRKSAGAPPPVQQQRPQQQRHQQAAAAAAAQQQEPGGGVAAAAADDGVEDDGVEDDEEEETPPEQRVPPADEVSPESRVPESRVPSPLSLSPLSLSPHLRRMTWRTAWRTMMRRRRHPSSACRPRTR
jgi:hypothetical protein